MLTNREWVSSRRITSIVQLVTVIGQKRSVAWCTQKWLHYFKWSGETKQPNLKICRARVDKEGLSRMPTAWRSAKKLVHIMKLSQELGENVTSSYQGSKISFNLSWGRRSFALSNDRGKVWATALFAWVQSCTGNSYMSICSFFLLY